MIAVAFFAVAVDGSTFTFMADDYIHLAKSYSTSSLFSDYFAAWLGRVPVWAATAYVLFESHVFERSWWPMHLFFATHALGMALVSAYLLRELRGEGEGRVPTAWVVAATAVFCLYPNDHEILYWPTCMPYTLGALFLGMAVWLSAPAARAIFLCLAGLTYETFLLPGLALLIIPPLAMGGKQSAAWRGPALVWVGALAMVLGVRYVGGAWFGTFHHSTDFALDHIAHQMLSAAALLFRSKHYHMHTHLAATAACAVWPLLILWRGGTRTKAAVLLVLGCFASTAVYWVLGYSAARAVYGSQVFLSATLVWIACQVWTLGKHAAWALVILMVLTALGFVDQQRELWQIKTDNAAVLAQRERMWHQTLRDCPEPCVLDYGNLEDGLRPDWVLPGSFGTAYVEWLRLKYAPARRVEMVQH